MLDQCFTAESFRKIVDLQNRRGIYLEARFFPQVDAVIRSSQHVHCGDAEVTTSFCIYLWRSFGVRQLAAAFLQASLLAGVTSETE